MKVVLFSLLLFSLNAFSQDAPPEGSNQPKDHKLKVKEAYPVGPYVDGQYTETTGEDAKQAEEEMIQETQAEEDAPTRVNKIGPQKW